MWQALHGPRQSPKDWFNCFTEALKSLKLRSMSEENCFWISKDGIIFSFYVYDSIIAYHKKIGKKGFKAPG